MRAVPRPLQAAATVSPNLAGDALVHMLRGEATRCPPRDVIIARRRALRVGQGQAGRGHLQPDPAQGGPASAGAGTDQAERRAGGHEREAQAHGRSRGQTEAGQEGESPGHDAGAEEPADP